MNRDPEFVYTHHDTPIGTLLLAGHDDVLFRLSFPSGSRQFEPEDGWRQLPGAFTQAREEIDAWFAGELKQFGCQRELVGTAFQLSVWRQLMLIPYGSHCSYADIAHRLGRPGAVRAVGAANGANPLPLIVPCHRVIGSDGGLAGFGGGVDLKRRLLAFESGQTPFVLTAGQCR